MRNTHFIPDLKNAQGALREPHFVRTIDCMKFGAQVRKIRKHKGLTLSEVELRAGLPDGNLSRIERGLQWVNEEKLYAIASALEVAPATLFTEGESSSATHAEGNLDHATKQWLGLRQYLGSEDIAEFAALIAARQERNRRLMEELDSRQRPGRPVSIVSDSGLGEKMGKKQSSQSS